MVGKAQLTNDIFKFVEIIRASIDREGSTLKIPSKLKDQFNSLYRSILESIVWSPGTLIPIYNPSERKAAEVAIDLVWRSVDSEDILDEITSGGYSGLLVNIMGDYADRIKMLKPTFISIDPSKTDFDIYFEEAMKAWVFGLNNSSLILCCSILENIFKQELAKIDSKLVYKRNGLLKSWRCFRLEFRLYKHDKRNIAIEEGESRSLNLDIIIDNAAKKKLISPEEKKIAHDIRELRNDAIHGIKKVSQERTYEAITNTKKLVEKLLT